MSLRLPLAVFCAVLLLLFAVSAGACPDRCSAPGHPGHFAAEDEAAAETESVDTEEDASEWDVNEPRGESFDIKFSTNEGTWMSLDVSPDGGTIVFDLVGDIYTISVDGGQATALTSGMAWDYQPRFSPDGTEILFTSDRAATLRADVESAQASLR